MAIVDDLITFGGGVFCAFLGYSAQKYSRDNGLTWHPCTQQFTNFYTSTAVGGNGIYNVFMTAAEQASPLSSNDGINWNYVNTSYNFAGYSWIVGATTSKLTIPGTGLKNLIAVGDYIYASTGNVAIRIDTTKDLMSQDAYEFPAPVPASQYVFANGPRYVYMFAQGDNTATNIVRYDPYPPNTTLQASILVDYKSSKTKPKTAFLPIVQSQKVTNMERMDIRRPVKELWLMGATSGYQYSNLASQCSLLINNEPLLSLDVGTQKYLKTIQPFETHTSMPIRNFSVLSFELDPESSKPNGTINFSRIHTQQFTGGATHAWASTYNILVIKDGMGGLMFN